MTPQISPGFVIPVKVTSPRTITNPSTKGQFSAAAAVKITGRESIKRSPGHMKRREACFSGELCYKTHTKVPDEEGPLVDPANVIIQYG